MGGGGEACWCILSSVIALGKLIAWHGSRGISHIWMIKMTAGVDYAAWVVWWVAWISFFILTPLKLPDYRHHWNSMKILTHDENILQTPLKLSCSEDLLFQRFWVEYHFNWLQCFIRSLCCLLAWSCHALLLLLLYIYYILIHPVHHITTAPL